MKRLPVVCALVIVMIILQIGLALRQSLWADEIFSLAMATGHSLEHPAAVARPELGDYVESEAPVSASTLRQYAEDQEPVAGFGRVLRAVTMSDTSPPLYYLLLRAWTRVVGVSDLALRLFSILFSVACVGLVAALGREIANARAGWMAAGLFVIAPMSLYYSTEGRMYSLLWCCVLVTALATVKLYRGVANWRWQMLWVGAAAAGMLVHYYFVFPLVAIGGFLVIWRGADCRGRWLARVTAVALLILPWYAKLPHTLAQWRITQHWVEWRPGGYNRWVVLRDLLMQCFSGNGHYLWNEHRMAEMLALVAFGVAGLLAWKAGRKQPGDALPGMVWLWFAAACVGPLAADAARGTFIAEYPRYSSAALPAACLLGGIALSRLAMPVGGLLMCLIGLGWAPSVASIYRSRSRSGQPMADVARHVSAYGRGDDLVLVHSIPSGAIGLARYATTPAAFATWVGQLGLRHVPESMVALLKDRRRVFLVKVHTVGEPAPEETWLRENAVLVKEKQLAEAFIYEFTPKKAVVFP
jgi:hypothetical protein